MPPTNRGLRPHRPRSNPPRGPNSVELRLDFDSPALRGQVGYRIVYGDSSCPCTPVSFDIADRGRLIVLDKAGAAYSSSTGAGTFATRHRG
jgi:hypothetical protein